LNNDTGDKVRKKESSKGFYQLFRESLKAQFIAAIFAIIAGVGFIFLDELKTLTREFFFYGTVTIIVEDQNLRPSSKVTILGVDNTPLRTFLLKTQTSAKLKGGNYTIQIHYPRPDGTEELILEKPLELKRRKRETVFVTYRLPNTISVNLYLPKIEYVTQELIHFNVMSDKGGYIWLFAPDHKGNPNPIFPNEGYQDNRIEVGKKYTIPPYDTFKLHTKSTPGKEDIVCIVSEINDKQFALSCLKKVIPSVSLKISVTNEALWGYDKKTITVK
jgi:hypothetical protein